MAMNEVPRVHTPHSAEQVRQALVRAWVDRFGESPRPDLMALMLAQGDLESAAFGSGMFHYNFGNLVVGKATTYDYYYNPPSDKTHRYRVYTSLDDAASDFVRQITSDTRPEWRDGFFSGDPEYYVAALGGLHGGLFKYYEAPYERYLNTFLGRWRKYAPHDADLVNGIGGSVTHAPKAVHSLDCSQSALSRLLAGSLPVVRNRRNCTTAIRGMLDKLIGTYSPDNVRAYQTAKGLTVDGIVGPQTWEALLSGYKE